MILNNKRALITGAGKGIGRSIAIAFARNGADICAVSRTREDVESLARQISQEYDVRAVAFQGDVSSAETVRELARKATSVLGEINVLVCAAGLPLRSEIWEKSLHELEEHHFLEAFQIDVMGSFLMAKELLPSMMKNKSGVIILFSSTPAVAGYHKGGSYTVAKAANLGLVKEIASEYGQYNIRAYAIAPGNIRTERTFSSLSKTEQENLAKEAPMKRWGEPDEVATVAVSLASENMSFVTGQTIVVDGGTVML